MNSLTINTLRRLNHFVVNIALAAASVLFATQTGNAQQLQQGVSVQMPPVSSATPMPEADNENAWIVTVTADSSLYFGINPVTQAGLTSEMKIHPRLREQKLYIKADARAPYAAVEKALAAARVDLFEDSVLLTSQAAASEPRTMVSPKGLEILLLPPAGSQPTEVQVTNSGDHEATMRVNNRQIPLANLQNMLTQIFQNRPNKVVSVKADGQLRFLDVLQVIDACHATGAKVVLPTPQL
jgi:biopolymer transport protein ExbD